MATAIPQTVMTPGSSFGPFTSGPSPSLVSAWAVTLNYVSFPLVPGSTADVVTVLVEESADGVTWVMSAECTIGDNPQDKNHNPVTTGTIRRNGPMVTGIAARIRVTFTPLQACTLSGSLSI